MRSFFVGLTLVFAGIAIGFVLARSLEVDSTSAKVVRGAEVARAADDEGTDSASDALEPVPGTTDRAPATAAAASGPDYEAALLEVAKRLPPLEGDGVVTGRVIDESGAPLEGATVIVLGPAEALGVQGPMADGSRIGRAYDESTILDPMARHYAASVLRGLRPAGRSETDASGRFEIGALAEGTYGARAFAEGFVFEATQTKTGSQIEFIGRAVSTFAFDVVRTDGSTPDEATIVVRYPGSPGMQYRWTPSAPEIRTESKVATVQALVGDVVRASQGEFRADARSGIRTLDIEVDGRGPHRLEVVDYPSVCVEVVQASEADGQVDAWCDLIRGDQTIPVERRDGGPFLALDVTAGPYTVAVGRGDGPPEETRNIVVENGRVNVQVELGALDPARFLVVRCADWKGRPVQDVWTFGASIRMGNRTTGTSFRPTARPGGEYLLSLERGSSFGRRHQIDRASIESFELRATSRRMGSVTIDVDPEATEVEITFETPCELVVEASGQLDAQLEIFIEVPRNDSGEWRSQGQRMSIPGDGSVAFTGLPAGPCRVVVKHQDFRRRERLVEVELELAPGANRARVEIPGAHDLVVLVPEMEGERFTLHRERDGEFEQSQSLTAEEDERLVFAGLPPGLYQLRHRKRVGVETMEVVVPCGEVVFEPMPVGGYEIVELPAGCPAARLGLQLGDVLVTVDGIDANTEMFLAEFTSRTMRDEGAMLVVRRAGSLTELPARFEDDRPERGILGHGARFKAQLR